MSVCPQCGKENLQGVPFCNFCGAALDEIEKNSKVESPIFPEKVETNPFAVGSQATSASAPSDSYDPVASFVPTGLGSAFQSCVYNCNKLGGRASRAEFWYWTLFMVLTFGPAIAILIAASAISVATETARSAVEFVEIFVAFLLIVWALVCVYPTFSLIVRRLHDFDRSAWFCLFLLLPVAQLFAMLYVGFASGTKGLNRYGPPPIKREAPTKNKTQDVEVRQ